MNQRVSISEPQAKGVKQASPVARSELDTGRYASMDKIVCGDESLSSPLDMRHPRTINNLGALLHFLPNSANLLAAPLVTGVTGVVVSFEFVAVVDVVFDASPGNTSPWSHCDDKQTY